MDTGCPFCENEAPKHRLIKTGRYAYVVLSSPRLMPGHTLVIPKRHVSKISDLRLEESQEIFELLTEFFEKIITRLATGCDIRQNYRPFQPADNYYKVNHLHFHLQPRTDKDNLYLNCQTYEQKIFQDLTPEELTEILPKLS